MNKLTQHPPKTLFHYYIHFFLYASPENFIGDKFHRVEEIAKILVSCGDLVTGEGRGKC